MADINLDELERLHREATQGRWVAYPNCEGHDTDSGPPHIDTDADGVIAECSGDHMAANTRLIAAMHSALPTLIAKARRAEEMEARLGPVVARVHAAEAEKHNGRILASIGALSDAVLDLFPATKD